MAYSPFRARVYAAASDSYFSDVRPAALMGRVQRIRLTEGQDASRPFQRFRPSRLDVETIISVTDASDRPYQAGYLVWLQVEVGTAAAATWFRGLMLTPDYRMQRQGRSLVRFSALDLSDALNEEITVSNQSNETIATNFGLLLDGVGWPDDADWRDIDADLIEQLSSWEHASGKAIRSAQELVDTVGPPARMVIQRNGGMRVIKNVADMPEASFTDADVRDLPDLQQHEDSVINTVTIEGTTLGSLSSTVRNSRPLEYDVLDGLAATERVNVIRRILRAYENGLTTLDLDFHADDDRNQATVAALEPGRVIELDSTFLGGTFEGPVSGLLWRWEGTRAFVRANVEVLPPPPVLIGLRLYLVGQYNDIGGFGIDRLYLIDVETGLAALIDVGDTQAHRAAAYDPNNDILYGSDGRNLYRINTITGAGTIIGPHGLGSINVESMAYDNNNDVLYVGLQQESDATTYYGICDTSNGDVSLISVPDRFGVNLRAIGGMAYDPAAHQIIMAGSDSNLPATLHRLTPETGAVLSSVDLSGVGNVNALAYDNGNGALYGVIRYITSFPNPDNLPTGLWTVRIDPFGTLTRIGSTADFGLSDELRRVGLAYMRLPDPP